METKILAKHLNFNSEWLYGGTNRLDGSFYINEGQKIQIQLIEKKIKTVKLSSFTEDIFYPTRFKRVYAKKKEESIKFISSSDMLRFEIDTVKKLSIEKNKINQLLLKRGWILISRSGTVGKTSYVYKNFEDLAGSDHIIRVVPKENFKYGGYLYSYLNSLVGHSLITSGTFGSVVDEIEPEDLKNIPIIWQDKKIQKEIHDKIILAFTSRARANKMFNNAIKMLYKELELPKSNKIENFIYGSDIKSWEVNEFNLRLRLEANYYNPDALNAIKVIQKNKNKEWIKQIGDYEINVINPPRSSRIYVERKLGIPYYSGTNLSQFCRKGVKNLAKIHKQIEEVKVKSGCILITRVGTIGMTYLVDDSMNGHCVSDNILRVISSKEILPEYLYLFLKSDYGKIQLEQIKTGSVQDFLPENYISDIWILVPDKKIQRKITKGVKGAMNLRMNAEILEEECRSHFDNLIFE